MPSSTMPTTTSKRRAMLRGHAPQGRILDPRDTAQQRHFQEHERSAREVVHEAVARELDVPRPYGRRQCHPPSPPMFSLSTSRPRRGGPRVPGRRSRAAHGKRAWGSWSCSGRRGARFMSAYKLYRMMIAWGVRLFHQNFYDDENGERDVPAGRLAAPPVEHDQITVLDGQPVCCVKERAD